MIVTRNIEGHGKFTADVRDYARAIDLPRHALVRLVLGVFEGDEDPVLEHPAHWATFPKSDLAIIAAGAGALS